MFGLGEECMHFKGKAAILTYYVFLLHVLRLLIHIVNVVCDYVSHL